VILNFGDALQNDSNKDFTWAVPVRVLWAFVTLVTTATVGIRVPVIEVFDIAAAPVLRWYSPMMSSSGGQAASLTRYYLTCTNTTRMGGFGGPSVDYAEVQVPRGLYIRAGWVLRIRDLFAIDVAADDMTVFGQVETD